MKVNKRSIEGYLIFDLLEDITYENARKLDAFITANLDPSIPNIVLNIKTVSYVNSFALGVLIKTMQEVEQKGCAFHLMNVHPDVITLLKVTGVLSKFKIFEKSV